MCICFVLLGYLRAHVSSGLTVTVTIHDVRPQGESYSVRAERVSAEIKSRWTEIYSVRTERVSAEIKSRWTGSEASS